nr:rop protein [Cloning vector Cam_FruR_TAN_CelR_KSL]
MTKQEKTALNMARFIRSQTLTLLEKLNELDADEQADICESLQLFNDPALNRRPGRICFRISAIHPLIITYSGVAPGV